MPNIEQFSLGTIEFYPVKVYDTFENLATLDGTGLTFDVYKDDEDETAVFTDRAATNEGLIALPLIDTVADCDEEGPYNMWIKFNALPEVPRLGPFRFRVDD